MPNAVSKPNPHADVCCDSSRHRSSAFEEKRREEGEGGRRWALACAAHQIKQISCKGNIFFLGVNFCGEGLWEKGRGEWHEIKQILRKDSIVFWR